jgi:AmiR/NasT family two-component response regulator
MAGLDGLLVKPLDRERLRGALNAARATHPIRCDPLATRLQPDANFRTLS